MQPYIARHDAEPRRIGRRLVEAGHAERAGAGAQRIGGELDERADGEPFRLGELPRDENLRWRGLLRIDDAGQHDARDRHDQQHGCDRPGVSGAMSHAAA